MVDEHQTEPSSLAAGSFSSWLRDLQSALRGERASDVPCAGCTACCTSSQFVHIEPDETETLSHIPPEVLFPAPRMPAGHVLLGYDEHGCCPMLTDDGCSIYQHRPRTCRTYDCRVFPASGAQPDHEGLLAERTRRWRFDHPTDTDQCEHDAVRAAARFIADHEDLVSERSPTNPTQLAVLAIEVHDTFLHHDVETGQAAVVSPDADEVRVALASCRPVGLVGPIATGRR